MAPATTSGISVIPDPLVQFILMNIQIAGCLRNADAVFSHQLTASSLYSRLNFLPCIHVLQFHWKHLKLVSKKPAAGQTAVASVRDLLKSLSGTLLGPQIINAECCQEYLGRSFHGICAGQLVGHAVQSP